MPQPEDGLPPNLLVQEIALWRNRAIQAERDASLWRLMVCGLLRSLTPSDSAVFDEDVLHRLVKEGRSLERVHDPKRREYLLRIYDPKAEGPPTGTLDKVVEEP